VYNHNHGKLTGLKGVIQMDDKDFDYEYYKEKYGIDLRSDDELDGEFDELQAEAPVKKISNKKSEQANRAKMELYDWLQCIVSAILCGILIFVFVGRVIGVDGNSMLNTLHDKDKVIMSNLFYTPKYGDIVVIKTEAFGETPLVKRVIATEGQTIDINFDTGEVSIDGRIIVEDYIRELTMERLDFNGPTTVPKGCVFVMGDNRNASNDSRDDLVGMVDTRQVLGKVLFVLIPGPNADGSRSWNRIGSAYKAS
jgi:signal peptidase I